MRKISVNKIKNAVSKLCEEANFNLRNDILKALKSALRKETNKRAKHVLKILLENARIARNERRALCQDTGMVSVYMKIGQEVKFTGSSLQKAVEDGIKESYKRNFLRKSVVISPILRINTRTNTPAPIYYEIVKGKDVSITVMPKGFGSENKSKQKMLNPTDGEKEITSFVLDAVRDAGPDACPPYILGIGIGGTFDKVSALAKQALIVPIDRPNPKKHLRKLENEILKKVNKIGIGPMGMGGKTTCLGVKILEYPTHIAGLPVAINIGCHITRNASKTI